MAAKPDTATLVAWIAARGGRATLAEVCMRYGLKWDAARRALRHARDEGLLVSTRNGMHSAWHVPGEGFVPPPTPRSRKQPRPPRPPREPRDEHPFVRRVVSAQGMPPPRTRGMRSVWDLGTTQERIG